MTHRSLGVAAIAAGLAFSAGVAHAGDLFPPPWRGTPGSTFQLWMFHSPSPFPDASANPFGVPIISSASVGVTWVPTTATGEGDGLWCIDPGGMLCFDIPNIFLPLMEKEAYIQVKYFGPGTVPGVSGMSGSGAPGVPCGPTTTPSPLPGGGSYWSTGLCFPDCWQFEQIWFTNPNPTAPIYIDQVVIDTRCIPSAGSFSLMAIGLLAACRRRR